MNRLAKHLVTLCSSSLVFLAFESDLLAQSTKKKRSRTHKHSHDHDHDHGDGHKHGKKKHSHDHGHSHSHSAFTLGVGMSLSKSFGNDEHDHEEGEDHDHAHLQGAALHGGHGGGGNPGEGGEPNGQPFFAVTAGYEINHSWQLSLTQGLASDTGIADTAFGVTHTLPFSSRTKLATQAMATAPLSKESKDTFKMTTVMLSTGPTWTKKRWEIGAKAYIAKSFYSKTVVIEEAGAETPLLLQDDHIDDHVLEELGATPDREFDRYGFESEIGYKFARRWQFGVGAGAAMATKQWGPTMYEVEATLAQLTFSRKSLSTSAGFMMTSEAESFSPPKTPTAAFNIMYIFE